MSALAREALLTGHASAQVSHLAALRHDEGREINVKKCTGSGARRGLQRRVRSPRKRAGTSSVLEVGADAPKVVWAVDF